MHNQPNPDDSLHLFARSLPVGMECEKATERLAVS